MELRNLRSFVVLAEELHFNHAAELLHLTQPSLTQQIKRLECEIGTPLFLRTSRHVELTPAGQELLARGRLILASVDDAMDAAGQAARGERGRLAVGYSGTATYELLPSMTRLFRAECPAVTLVLRGEMLTPALETALLHHDLDVAFLRPPVAAPELRTRILRREPLGVLLPEQHPLARLGEVDLEALAQEPFVTHPAVAHGVMFSIMQRACVAAGFRPRIVQEASETSVVASLVAAGIGVAILPLSVRYIHVTGAVLRPLTARDLEIELAIAWRREDTSPTVERFLAIATNALAPSA